jgi:arsenate reductase
VHNAGRSQIAAALFNRDADPRKARAISAGTDPAEQVHPEVVALMRGMGIDLSGQRPQKLTAALASQAQWLITMGCGDQCPVVPGAQRVDWPLPDPKGQPTEAVRAIVAAIQTRVTQLIESQAWQ